MIHVLKAMNASTAVSGLTMAVGPDGPGEDYFMARRVCEGLGDGLVATRPIGSLASRTAPTTGAKNNAGPSLMAAITS